MSHGKQSTSKKQSASKRSPVLWVAGIAVVAVALITVFVIASGGDDADDVQADDGTELSQVNDVTIDGAALEPFQDIETVAGTPAPQVTGVDFAGEAVTLIEPGTPTVVAFFAHWCPHCQSEVDELSRYLGETGLPDDVDLIAVSTSVNSDDGNYPPSAWFESEAWPTSVLTDDADSSVARAYGLSGFPFWAVVDADGNLVTRVSGGIGAEEFEALVDLASTGV